MATRSKKDVEGDSTQDLFYSLDPAARNAIRAKVLEALVTEQDASARNKMGDAVAEIARQYAAEGESRMCGRCKRTSADWRSRRELARTVGRTFPMQPVC